MAKSLKSSSKYKASKLFLDTRFACLPDGLVTKEQFKKLKAGEAILIDPAGNERYFVAEGAENGSSDNSTQ